MSGPNETVEFRRITLLRASEIIARVLGVKDVGLLYGPSHAEEVARGMPASVTSAARDPLPGAAWRCRSPGPCTRCFSTTSPPSRPLMSS